MKIRKSRVLLRSAVASMLAFCAACESSPRRAPENATPTAVSGGLAGSASPVAAVATFTQAVSPTQTPPPTIDIATIVGGMSVAASTTKSGVEYSFYAVSSQTGIDFHCDLYLRVTQQTGDAITWQVTEPAACWDFDWATLGLPEGDREGLSLSGSWSDLNRNGWPEYSVILVNSCGACDDANSGRVAHFEIGPEGAVSDIAFSGDGDIVLFRAFGEYVTPFGLAYDGHPDLLIVTKLAQYDLHRYVEVPGLLEWSTDRFMAASGRHPEVIRGWIENTKAQIAQGYGQPLTEGATEPLWRLLGLFNQSDVAPGDARDAFLQVSGLEQWPGTEKAIACWVQVMRAQVQIDAEERGRFEIYSFEGLTNAVYSDLDHAIPGIDKLRFDVSECPA